MMNKAGRRITLAGSLLISGLTCLSTGLVPEGKFQNPNENLFPFEKIYLQAFLLLSRDIMLFHFY